MKGIVVTEKNYNQVIGRLKKFFAHKSFIVWHTFNVGMRPRFSDKVYFRGDYYKNHFNTRRKYSNVHTGMSPNGKFLVIDLCLEQSFIIDYGYEILFLGSRIVIKSYHEGLGKYLYETYQMN